MRLDKHGKPRSARPNDWTDVLAPEVIRQFEGKHIAIVYKRVIASGPTFDAVLEECLQLFPDETPYLAYIPTPEEAEDEDFSVSGSFVQGQSETSLRQTPGSVASPNNRLTYDQDYVPETEGYKTPGGQIGALTPTKGPTGSIVTITGSGLNDVSQVLFGDLPAASFTVLSDYSVSAVVPGGAASALVSAVTPSGTLTSIRPFAVIPPPSLNSFAPPLGGLGTRITISGAFLNDASKVTFEGGGQAQIISSTATALVVVLPPGASTGRFSVTTPGGTAWSDSAFNVVPPPFIGQVIPLTGTVGERVTISGIHLGSVNSVSFGSVRAEKLTAISSSELSVLVPPGASSGLITLTTAGGTTSTATKFTVIQQPIVKSFTPTADGVGSKVMITGAFLSGATSVAFNGVPAAKFTVISPTFVSVEVPSGATTGPLSITTPGGVANSTNEFIVVPPPTISSVDPISGPAGTKITIRGDNFHGATKVLLNDIPVESFNVESSGVITIELDKAAENGIFKVTTPGGTTEGSTNFTVIPLPTITSFSPTFGPVGGVITVIGTNLEKATAAYINKAKANVSSVTGTKATVFVPSDASTGRISIMTPFGYCDSSSDFEVITASAIKDIAPSSGVAGTFVTIIGWGFKTGTVVYFGGVASSAVTVNSNNTITAQVPYGALTGDVVIEGPSGAVTGPRPFNVTSSIVSINPDRGLVGTPVTISGVGLSGVTSLSFNGVKAEFEVKSDVEILTKSPAGSNDGPVQISSPLGSTASPSNFFYSNK